MAGEWIPLRRTLRTDPRTLKIATKLKIHRDTVVGKLHAMWCLVGENTVDGRYEGCTPQMLDLLIEQPGWSAALVAAGWLVLEKDAVVCPEWDTWNARCARRRLSENDRKARSRAQDDRNQSASTADKKRPKNDNDNDNDNDTTVTGTGISLDVDVAGASVSFSQEITGEILETFERLVRTFMLRQPDDLELGKKIAVLVARGEISEKMLEDVLESPARKIDAGSSIRSFPAFLMACMKNQCEDAGLKFTQLLAKTRAWPPELDNYKNPCAGQTAGDNRI